MRWRRGDSESSSGPTEIAVWHGYQDTEGDVFKGLVDQYNKEHPDVKVSELYSSNDLVLQKVLTAVRGNSAPDVAYMFGSWAPNIAKISSLVDMTEEVAKPDWKWDDFYEAERKAATVGDKVIGVPALVDNLAIVYNKKLFADAGVAASDAGVDVGRLPCGRCQTDRPGQGTVRLADPRRRQRRHCLALASDALGGRRQHPERRTTPRPRSTPRPASRR